MANNPVMYRHSYRSWIYYQIFNDLIKFIKLCELHDSMKFKMIPITLWAKMDVFPEQKLW
jgi:hypothetical protein